MEMLCKINSILKFKQTQGYPTPLEKWKRYQAQKEGYRIFPIDVPIQLVDEDWLARADIIIIRLVWEKKTTHLDFEVDRIYQVPFQSKAL